jgi:Zn-dependent peptidase ImmA (M78 family)
MKGTYDSDTIKDIADKLLVAANVTGIFPCPIEKVISFLGFSSHLFTTDANTANISGAVDHKNKKVYVNASEPPQRRLFTAAHEVGHIKLHASEDCIDYRGPTAIPYDPKENEADLFAACLLMPEKEFKKQWQRFLGDIYKVSCFFGASKPAVALRADSLGLA